MVPPGSREICPGSTVVAAFALPRLERPLDRVRRFVGLFVEAEKLVLVLILCATVLVLIYFYS
jgi:hypothetical protein